MKSLILFVISLPLIFAGCSAKKSMSPYEARINMSSQREAADYATGTTVTAESSRPGTARGGSTSYAKKLRAVNKDIEVADKNDQNPSDSKPESKSDAVKISRMIIYYGNLSISVLHPEQSLQKALKIAEDMGGYMKSRNNFRVVLRIPSAKFFKFISIIEPFGEVTSRRIRSEDVTAQFVDLSMRMNNLLKARERLLAILAKAVKVKDTLEIEREITRVTGQLEQIKGQLRYLQNLVSFATVTLRFHKKYSSMQSSGQKIKLESPIYWISTFDINNLLRN
ncbi:MAG: DUF4349 domain-containing protein [Deltaproteobacteria bacterium]|nr:DUF4349 domain-containing protein [Deltaproteobacteria bacterium]